MVHCVYEQFLQVNRTPLVYVFLCVFSHAFLNKGTFVVILSFDLGIFVYFIVVVANPVVSISAWKYSSRQRSIASSAGR